MKYVIILLGFSTFIMFSACTNIASQLDPPNQVTTTIIYKNTNPSKTYKCIYYGRIGESEAQLILHMSILPINAKFDSTQNGNIFISQIKHLEKTTTQLCKSSWEDDTHLEVVLMDNLLIKKNENYYVNGKDTINIKYVP